MVSLFKLYFNLKLMFLIVILIPFTLLVTPNQLVAMYTSSNYIYIFLNILYILFSYKRVNKYFEISNVLIIRIGKEKFEKYNLYLSLISVFLYIFWLYAFLLIFYPIYPGYEIITLLFGIINLFVMLLIEFSIMTRIYFRYTFIFILLPVMINFIYRYLFVIPWANNFFK